jgi:hypothetical protein
LPVPRDNLPPKPLPVGEAQRRGADDKILDDQTYIVFPDNVLPDEAGHLPLPPD